MTDNKPKPGSPNSKVRDEEEKAFWKKKLAGDTAAAKTEKAQKDN
jgi:hypothetical protein